jgi:hypothetical protein
MIDVEAMIVSILVLGLISIGSRINIVLILKRSLFQLSGLSLNRGAFFVRVRLSEE